MEIRWEARLPMSAEDACSRWVDVYERIHATHGDGDGHMAVVRSHDIVIADDVLGRGRFRTRTLLRRAPNQLAFETTGKAFRAAGRITFHVSTLDCRVTVEGRVESQGLGRYRRGLEEQVSLALVGDFERHAQELAAPERPRRGVPPA